MGLIKKHIVSGITDRIAAQHEFLRDGFESAAVEGAGAGFFYPRIHNGIAADDTLPDGDADVERNLVGVADDLDNNFLSGTTINSIYSSFLRSMASHFNQQGSSNFDTYLTQQDINVHEEFNAVYRAVFGSDLNAINVFRKTPAQLGLVTMTGSGVGTFTDGVALGTGTGKFASNSNSAGAQLQAYLGSGALTTEDLVINLTVLNENGSQTANLTATIVSGADTGATADFGNPTTNGKIIDILSASMAGGSSGEVVGIRQIIEREPSL